MSLLAPTEGDIQLLQHAVKDTAATDTYDLRLYTNTHTPAKADTVASYTEAGFTGYTVGGISLTRAGWSTPVSTGTPNFYAQSTYAQQTWSPTTSQQIIGYFIVEHTSGKVLWAEQFAAARTLNNGDTLNLTPQVQLN